jgi:3-oxoacyl-[acyl-carrier protein] reductase
VTPRARGSAKGRPADAHALAGKHGIVTGGAHGIGRAVALKLARMGADVGINYWTSADDAKATARQIERLGQSCVLLPGDLGSERSVRKVVVTAEQRLGTIDFLVNNAGGSGGAGSDNSIDTAGYADWSRVMSSNLGSAFLCSRYVSPIMMHQKSGRIVNISSICGITGDCGPGYCAAKAGMLGLTRHSAVALAPYVQVNAILPGFIDSQPHDSKRVGEITPGRSMGHPEDVADLCGYLISSPRSFLTGACIVLDGSVMNGIIGRMMDWSEARSIYSR